jgi:valyl-tRNA synthetase
LVTIFAIGIFLVNCGGTNPAYFYGDGKEDFVVAESIEEARVSKVKLITKPNNPNLRQDVDALDTWFSSWLWPMCFLEE